MNLGKPRTKNQDLARGWQTALFPIEVETISALLSTEKHLGAQRTEESLC